MLKRAECPHCKQIKGGWIWLDDEGKRVVKLSDITTGEHVQDIMFWNDITEDLKGLFAQFESKKIDEEQLLKYCWAIKDNIDRVEKEHGRSCA